MRRLARFAPRRDFQQHPHPLQQCLFGKRFQQYPVRGAPGKRIGGQAAGVPGYVEDLEAGVLAAEIGSQVEAAHPRHHHIDDGQIERSLALPHQRETVCRSSRSDRVEPAAREHLDQQLEKT